MSNAQDSLGDFFIVVLFFPIPSASAIWPSSTISHAHLLRSSRCSCCHIYNHFMNERTGWKSQNCCEFVHWLWHWSVFCRARSSAQKRRRKNINKIYVANNKLYRTYPAFVSPKNKTSSSNSDSLGLTRLRMQRRDDNVEGRKTRRKITPKKKVQQIASFCLNIKKRARGNYSYFKSHIYIYSVCYVRLDFFTHSWIYCTWTLISLFCVKEGEIHFPVLRCWAIIIYQRNKFSSTLTLRLRDSFLCSAWPSQKGARELSEQNEESSKLYADIALLAVRTRCFQLEKKKHQEKKSEREEQPEIYVWNVNKMVKNIVDLVDWAVTFFLFCYARVAAMRCWKIHSEPKQNQ